MFVIATKFKITQKLVIKEIYTQNVVLLYAGIK